MSVFEICDVDVHVDIDLNSSSLEGDDSSLWIYLLVYFSSRD